MVAALTWLSTSTLWAQTGTVTGTVTDADTGESLPGANVLVEGTAVGDAADADGRYAITRLPVGTYVLIFTFTGYQNTELSVTVSLVDPVVLDVALKPGVELDPLQVTAGRRREKALYAPASISILSGRDIELEAPQTAVRALRNVTALDMVQTGVDRHEVALRGFNSAFSGSPHVLTDYRQASAAVIGVNVHSIMPVLPIDVERVEVVRGPGSALYGPGVDAGVIHYISKDPFTYPGLTLAVAGGEQSLMNVQGRLAGVVAGRLGLKVTGTLGRANDFTLEACEEELLRAQRFSECPDELDAQQLYIDGPRDNRFRKAGLTLSAEYRFGKSTSLIFSGGTGQVSTTVLSGVGTLQGVNYVSSFGQVRFNSGPFFAQAYLNSSDSNDTYVYSGDAVVERSTQTSIQAQYDMSFGGDRQELIAGIDLELLSPNSGGTVHGRNEGNDYIQELGVYAQSKTRLSERLDLVAALRADFHTVFQRVWLSPRAALVYKASPVSSMRLTLNSAVVHPAVISLFLDHVASRIPIGGGNEMLVRARGGTGGYTWYRNAAYTQLGAPTDLVASCLLPGLEGTDMPVGLSTGVVYNLMYEGLVAIPNEELAQMLLDALGLDAGLLPLLTSQVDHIKGLLHPDQTVVDGFSSGALGLLNLGTQAIDPAPNELEPLPGIKPKISRTIELGYRSIINDHILISADVYYTEQKNFAGALQMKTPFVLVPGLTHDLARDLAAGIAGNADLLHAMELIELLVGVDLSPEEAANLLMGLAEGDLPDASTPVGVVQPRENHAGAGLVPELLITYPNFGHITYFGADLAAQVLLSESADVFANMSWVSDDFFDHTETGEKLETAVLALNAPAFKFKVGGTWRHGSGLLLTASGRYVSGFRMISGQYIGSVDPYLLMDLGVGYQLRRGLRADLNVSNMTNNVRREFIGAPKIGRVATVRILYTTVL